MKTKVLLFVITLMAFTFGCTNNDQVVVNATESIGENLNLKAVGEIVKNSKTPQEIEQKLNQENGVNNLDLDGDGKTDYLKVSEYGSGNQHGYSICAVLKDGEPEVAKIEINSTNNNQVQMTVNGNQQYYGNNNCYQSNFTMTDFLLWSYIMSPGRIYYASPYHYGYYGYGYMARPIVPYHSYYSRPTMTTYRTTTKTTYRTVNNYQSNIKSPNSSNVSKSATTHVTNLSNPSRSQKSFSTGSGSAPRSGGFGSKSSGYSGSKSSGSSSHSSGSSSHSSGSWGHSSGGSHSSGGGHRCDIRAKDDIQIIPSSSSFLTQIYQIDVASYYYNPLFVKSENLSSDKQIGYLAQNVENVFPTAVSTDISGYKNVDYYQMTAINTIAIKSLIKAVSDLQRENAELKAKLNSR